jgi:hypothetical protein
MPDFETEALEIAICLAVGAINAICMYSVQARSHVYIRAEHFLQRFELSTVSGQGLILFHAIGPRVAFISVQVLKKSAKASRTVMPGPAESAHSVTRDESGLSGSAG